MNRLFIVIMAAIVIFCIALAVYVYVALIPYFRLVGYIALALLIVIVLCAIAFIVVFTFAKTSIMLSERQIALNKRELIIVGELAVWKRNDGTYVHISAMHEAAKVPPMLSQGSIVDQDTPDEIEAFRPQDIIEMTEKGISERSIVEAYKDQGVTITRHQIKKILGKV